MNILPAAIAALATLALATVAPAQEPTQLEKSLEKKLAAEFLTKASWTTDYDAARTKAKEAGKTILAYFTRSYAP